MTTIKDCQTAFAHYLETHRFTQEPTNLYEPVNYIMDLGGKRIRPALVLLAHSLFADHIEAALPAAMSVEVFHNFSLVHDDIMDEAPVRRGQPTLHQKYGLPAGILSGDVMLIHAGQFLTQCKPESAIGTLVRVFNSMAIEVCEGQQMDMDFEKELNCTIPMYLKMIELKTGALIGASLELGAVIAGASESDVQQLRAFGRKLGIAFQLQDDYLDTFGDPEKFGKKPGGDIVRNKKTFLVLKAAELANPEQKLELDAWMGSTDHNETTKIAAVVKLFQTLGVQEETRSIMTRFHEEALAHLAAVQTPEMKKKGLLDLSDMLFNRDF